jgi:hypothetical protein
MCNAGCSSSQCRSNHKWKSLKASRCVSAQKRVRIRPRLARPYSSQVARRSSIGRSLPATPAGSAGSAGKNSNIVSSCTSNSEVLPVFLNFKIHIVKLQKSQEKTKTWIEYVWIVSQIVKFQNYSLETRKPNMGMNSCLLKLGHWAIDLAYKRYQCWICPFYLITYLFLKHFIKCHSLLTSTEYIYKKKLSKFMMLKN